MIIDIQRVPHKSQRYDSCGDWSWCSDFPDRCPFSGEMHSKKDHEVLHFRVSEMSDRRYEWLITIHELIECVLCWLMDVSPIEIDYFDMEYEDARKSGVAPCGCKITPEDEPGNDKHAPYYKQHRLALRCETSMAILLRVQWRRYEKEVMSLEY